MSKRIQVTLPDRLAEDLEKWATYDGRPLSNLAAYLLERAVAEAKKEGAEWTVIKSRRKVNSPPSEHNS